jgi:hypothetical protein
MRSLVAVVSVAAALMLPASSAFARPVDGPTGLGSGAQAVSDGPSPVAATDGGGGAPLGYIVVGLGGFALGAAGFACASSARRSRRVLEA